MENATKALLMAGGVLIAIIIISVLVVTFQKTGSVSKTYDKTIDQEEITKFNTNFTKYLGQDLTIHEVVTICNFARQNNIEITYGEKYQSNIAEDLNKIKVENGKRMQKAYTINILSYNENTGFISQISFNEAGMMEI